MQIRPGSMYPLGASCSNVGVNFALYSQVAQKVELCPFDKHDVKTRIEMTERNSYVWCSYIPGLHPDRRYSCRAYGPYDPVHGLRCSSNKLLLNPYTRAIEGNIDGDKSLLSCWFRSPDDNSAMNDLNSAVHTMKSVVINPYFDWGNDQRPYISYHNSVIYEAHVRGMTNLNVDVPPDIYGTYAGLAYPSIIKYLKRLNITAVELIPIHQFVNGSFLQKKSLSNYWGYNTVGFFAPHNAHSSSGERGEQVNKFKSIVKTYHRTSMEIILDVVYSHIAEGNHMGSTLSFKGIDNTSYYQLVEDDQQHYFDTTGTGNSLLMRSPHALQLITDSLRYWVTEVYVDNFCSDLTATLARQSQGVDKLSALFDIVEQDPVISRVKLIAEPWDLGSGGYQMGSFPSNWSEWNGRYRDTVRDFWRSQPSTLPKFASRLIDSSDLYQVNGRRSVAPMNLIITHDGFTMNSLVSYNEEHNGTNDEGDRDDESSNRSWNYGVEGPTNIPDVNDLHQRQMRNTFATLLFSQGIPMICGGDEVTRIQQGNNNVYCQGNKVFWTNWHLDKGRKELLAFIPKLIHLRLDHPVLHRRRSLTGCEPGNDSNVIPQIEWFGHTGSIMNVDDWQNTHAFSMMVYLNGSDVPEVGWYGNRMVDNDFILIFNAHYEPIMLTLPDERYDRKWQLVVDTHNPSGPGLGYKMGFIITAQSCSFPMLMSDKKLKRPMGL